MRKQFPLRPASAKTVHRSQGDTQSQIVVNLNTKRAIPHIHYVALSRVTTIEGLHITDLCEDKISIDQRYILAFILFHNSVILFSKFRNFMLSLSTSDKKDYTIFLFDI